MATVALARSRGGSGVVVRHARDLATKVLRYKVPFPLIPATNSTVGPSVGATVGSHLCWPSLDFVYATPVIGPSGGPLIPLITTNELAMPPCGGWTIAPAGHASMLAAAFATVVVPGHRSAARDRSEDADLGCCPTALGHGRPTDHCDVDRTAPYENEEKSPLPLRPSDIPAVGCLR